MLLLLLSFTLFALVVVHALVVGLVHTGSDRVIDLTASLVLYSHVNDLQVLTA
jgi:hypothetical protein